MKRLTTDETKVVRGIVFRRDPAREPCFTIVHLHQEVPDKGGFDPEHRRQRLHREFNQEVQTLEIAALCLVDFPNAPWELRLELARQCWDEARHSAMCERRLKEMGGWKGMYPIANLDWCLVAMLASLPARLTIQHRIFEAGSLDISEHSPSLFKEAGDPESAAMMEAIDADEIQHVRFANEWLKRLTDVEPRSVLDIAAAVSWLRRVVAATGGEGLHAIATSEESRRLAGFSSAEIAEVTRLENQRPQQPDSVMKGAAS